MMRRRRVGLDARRLPSEDVGRVASLRFVNYVGDVSTLRVVKHTEFRKSVEGRRVSEKILEFFFLRFFNKF